MAQTKMKKKGANTSLVFTNKMYFFLIPALAFFLIFWIYPVLQLFYYSVTNFNGVNYDFDFVGMKNYIKVLNNGTLTNSMKNTLVYAVITVLLSNVVGLAVAMILNTKIRLKGPYLCIFSGIVQCYRNRFYLVLCLYARFRYDRKYSVNDRTGWCGV